MAELKLLAAIRARATDRGMTLTDLAHAAGVQPGNLRRMFARTAASPRLGSVMRLLPPLHCHIAPAGARTAAALTAYLDGERQRQNLDWGQLSGLLGERVDKVAAGLLSEPEKLSLPAVMRLADALHVELLLADSEAQGVPDAPERKRRSTSPRRPAPRNRAVHAAEPQRTPTPPSAASARQPPASPPVLEAPPTTSRLGPLRPPRLGRYRDAPPVPPGRPSPASWTPQSRPSPVFAGALVAPLVEISNDTWSDLYASIWDAVTKGASIPVRFTEGLGKATAEFLSRLRGSPATRPAVSDPPDGWYDMLDPALLVQPWLASRQPGYRSIDTSDYYDEHGIRIGHLALDSETMVAIRLAPQGHPHRLVDLVHLPRNGEKKFCLSKEVPLAVKLGGERQLFRHIKAGPVFGEIVVSDHVYLLAAVSSLLVILDVYGERASIVWGGRAEKLPAVVIDPPSPGTILVDDPTATVAELERRLAEAQALLEAEREVREHDRYNDAARELNAEHIREQIENTLRFATELQSQLSAQTQERLAAESRCQLAEARLKKIALARDGLAAELAALRAGAAARTGDSAAFFADDPTATVTELERRLAEAEALLAAERRAREDERRSPELRGQATEQTREHVENTLRYITELQTQLRAQTQERLEVEEKRLIAEDKRVMAESRLTRVALARDELAAELAALRASAMSQHTLPEQSTAENSALVEAEHRARLAADEATRLAQQLAASQAQEQVTRDTLAAVRQELEGVRQTQADEMSQIRELIAAKHFPEAVMHSLARSLGESDVEAVADYFPQQEGGTEDSSSSTSIPDAVAPSVAAQPSHGRRKIVSTAPPAEYPAYHAASAVRKPGRNESCPCGSGKKYKRCCGMAAT